MRKDSRSDADKRVPVALGVMAMVLALLGSQHLASGPLAATAGAKPQVSLAATSVPVGMKAVSGQLRMPAPLRAR